jgi:alpha-tubulin suppressor-like RCC1 family protein
MISRFIQARHVQPWAHHFLTCVALMVGSQFIFSNDTLAQNCNGPPRNAVWAWGPNNQFGQQGIGGTGSFVPVTQIQTLSGVKAVAAGDFHSLALLADDTVWAWGNNDTGQLGDGTTTDRNTPELVLENRGVTAVSAGGEHSLALLADGTVRAWGGER